MCRGEAFPCAVFRRNLALVLCRLGLWEEGVAVSREVVEADPEDTEATRALYIAVEKARPAQKRGTAEPKPR